MTELIQQLRAAIREDRDQARQRAHVAICESKRRYPTKAAAKTACHTIAHKGGNPNMTSYQCPVCRQWHLKRP